MASVKVIDLFCGTGGFSKGFENSTKIDYETVLGIDLLPIATKTFGLNHPTATGLSGDIRKVRRSDLASQFKIKKKGVDLIIGGPPCQGFSSIRPFRSTNDDDPRNSLFEEFASFVNYYRPKAFVLENVVGLATHKNGETIEIIEECFHALGYDCDWKILNAAHFGIPQKRERLVMIGVQRGGSIHFPVPTHSHSGSTIGHKDVRRMLAPVGRGSFNEQELESAITVMEAISDLPKIKSGEKAEKYIAQPENSYQRDRRKRLQNLDLHRSTDHSDKMLEIIKHAGKNINCIPKGLITSGFSSCYSRLDADNPSVTITVNFVHPASNRCIHPNQNRALTPREGARLQSFDDDFVFAGNRSQITKQIGNAVPPLLGKAIGEALSQTF